MAPEAQLDWEARAGRPVAGAAFGAALLPIAGGVTAAQIERPDFGDARAAEFLFGLDAEPGLAMAGTVLQALGVLLLIPVFLYLQRAISHRRPEFPRVALIVAVLGPLIYVVVTTLIQIDRIDTAGSFVDAEGQLPVELDEAQEDALDERAEDALDDGSSPVLAGFGLGAQLALAIAFVLFGLWMMRTGLLSRFMGTLGIVVGALYVIPLLGGPQIIQLFWLISIGLLLLGRWPGGRGPAWETGTDEPWPSAADQREAAERARAEQEEHRLGRREPAPDEPSEDELGEGEAEDVPAAHPRSRKRKRKRRR